MHQFDKYLIALTHEFKIYFFSIYQNHQFEADLLPVKVLEIPSLLVSDRTENVIIMSSRGG